MNYIIIFFIFGFYHIWSYAFLKKKISIYKILFDGIFFFLFHTLFFYMMNGNLLLDFSFSNLIYIFIHSFLYYYFINFYLIKKKGQVSKQKIPSSFLLFLFLLLFSYLIEFTVFNYKHYVTFHNQPFTSSKIKYHGIKKIDDKHIQITENDNVSIELQNINKKVNSLYIRITPDTYSRMIPFTIFATDEANHSYRNIGNRKSIDSVLQSKYFIFHLSGKSEKIKLKIDDKIKGYVFYMDPIIINPKIPFHIDVGRVLIMTVFFFLLYLIRPTSLLYKYKAIDKFRYKKAILVLTIFLCIFGGFLITSINPNFDVINNDTSTQYYELSESLLKGKFYLEKKPSKKLQDLKNPYDSIDRNSKLKRGIDYSWDTAYYKGKYYVYFGITPVLVFFLPIYALFHIHVSILFSVLFFSILCIMSIFYLLYQIIKKWFPNVSFISYLLLCIFFVSSSGLFYILKRPTFYKIAIVCALMFTILSLGLWISSTLSKKHQKLKLFLGSVCMALVAGSRPQMLVSLFFVPFIFYREFFKEKSIFKKENRKNLLCFLLPLLLYALFIMYYNYARFSSIFDFGANYNLTTNDMTKRGFVFERIFSGIYYFLLAPTTISPLFPYFYMNTVKTSYLGTVIAEPFFGGFLYNHFITVFAFFIYKFKRFFQKKEVYYMGILSTVMAVIVLIFDTEFAGMLPRYISDFAYLLLLSTCFVVFALDSSLKGKKKQSFRKVLMFLLTLSFLYEFFFLFTDINMQLEQWNPNIFYNVSHFFEFWV